MYLFVRNAFDYLGVDQTVPKMQWRKFASDGYLYTMLHEPPYGNEQIIGYVIQNYVAS